MDNNKDFDLNKFNAEFEDSVLKRKDKAEAEMQANLNALNSYQKKRLYVLDLSVGQTLIGVKDTVFGMMDDILTMNIDRTFLTKDNRLYFIGILLLLIVVYVVIHNLIFSESKSTCSCGKVPIYMIRTSHIPNILDPRIELGI